MPSTHDYIPSELPAPYSYGGCAWMASRLAAVGYTETSSWWNEATNIYSLQVGEDNVSKNQLAFDVQPPDGQLSVDIPSLNVPVGDWRIVEVSGPDGEVVDVFFKGVGFVTTTQFTIPPSGKYNFQFGPCPVGRAVVDPQQYEFRVSGTRISPVAVLATFR